MLNSSLLIRHSQGVQAAAHIPRLQLAMFHKINFLQKSLFASITYFTLFTSISNMPYYVDKATRHPSIAYYNSPFSKLLPLISHFTETVQKCKAAPCASPLPFRASDRITGAGIRPPKSGSPRCCAPRNDSAALPRSDCQKTCPVTSIGGKDSVKGNRQGSLSRSITRLQCSVS